MILIRVRLSLLELLPQTDPFLFVDEILEVSDDHIVARFTFRDDHDFYRGHFPDRPVTPGVILLESLAQVGVVGLGLYQIARDEGRDAVRDALALFTDADVDFTGLVRPGDRVTIRATKVFWRRRKIRSKAEYHRAAKRAGAEELSISVLDRLPASGGEPRYVDTERYERLEAGVARLPESLREVLLLRSIEGLSNLEAAEVLNKSPEATSKLYNRALARLGTEMGAGT